MCNALLRRNFKNRKKICIEFARVISKMQLRRTDWTELLWTNFFICLLMNVSIQLKYWLLSSLIGELIALVLPGWTQLTPRNKIKKKKLIECLKVFICDWIARLSYKNLSIYRIVFNFKFIHYLTWKWDSKSWLNITAGVKETSYVAVLC